MASASSRRRFIFHSSGSRGRPSPRSWPTPVFDLLAIWDLLRLGRSCGSACFTDQPLRRNATARWSSNFGCDGVSPVAPNYRRLRTRPTPNRWCQTRLTMTRAAAGCRLDQPFRELLVATLVGRNDRHGGVATCSMPRFAVHLVVEVAADARVQVGGCLSPWATHIAIALSGPEAMSFFKSVSSCFRLRAIGLVLGSLGNALCGFLVFERFLGQELRGVGDDIRRRALGGNHDRTTGCPSRSDTGPATRIGHRWSALVSD